MPALNFPSNASAGDVYASGFGPSYRWDGVKWTVIRSSGGGGGIPDAPITNQFYVRQNAQWADLRNALNSLGVSYDQITDGGNFTTGTALVDTNGTSDGGNFTTGSSSAVNSDSLDGGFIGDAIIDGGNFSEN